MKGSTAFVVERSITLEAAVRDGRLTVMRLHAAPTDGIAQALAAQPLADIPVLAARLFPICGMAHACAAVGAIEAALGVAVSPAQAKLRELLVLAEHGAAAAWRLTVDWPALFGEPPDLRTCADIRRAAAAVQAVAPREIWAQIGGATGAVDRAKIARRIARLARLLDTLVPEAAAHSLDELHSALAASRSVAARVIGAARALPAQYGAHDCPNLTAERAQACGAAGGSIPAETGPLAAERHPLVAEAAGQWGRALASRLLAAALDASAVAARLDRLAADTCEPSARSASGVVETARGMLAYRVEVTDGRVTKLSSIAPTDCNFHPRGPFMAALAAAPAVADPVFAARLLAASFDPCVPFALRVVSTEAADTEALCDA